MSNRQIAEGACCLAQTAGHHLENIYATIGISTRFGATLFALQRGIVQSSRPA
jgi:DNA-binding NarL/FixJ family response regulator